MGLLSWFRGLLRNPSEPYPESGGPGAAGPEAGDGEPGLRVRGLLLLNLQPSQGPESIEGAPPLGSRDAVISALRAALPGIAFEPDGRAVFHAGEHRVAIEIGPGDPVPAAVAAADGAAGIERVRALVQAQGWRIYVPRAGTFVDPGALPEFARSGTGPAAEAS